MPILNSSYPTFDNTPITANGHSADIKIETFSGADGLKQAIMRAVEKRLDSENTNIRIHKLSLATQMSALINGSIRVIMYSSESDGWKHDIFVQPENPKYPQYRFYIDTDKHPELIEKIRQLQSDIKGKQIGRSKIYELCEGLRDKAYIAQILNGVIDRTSTGLNLTPLRTTEKETLIGLLQELDDLLLQADLEDFNRVREPLMTA